MSNSTFKEKLPSILDMLNSQYSQDSENYSIIHGPKPEIIRFDEETAISLWACGAIVCVKSIMYFISEDDGYWFCPDWIDSENIDEDGMVGRRARLFSSIGMQDSFSVGWIDSFTKAMKNLKDYLKDNGTPVYYSGTDSICHYTL